MTDNIVVKDGNGLGQMLAAKDTGTVLIMRHNIVDESDVLLVGQKASAASLPMVVASDQSDLPTKPGTTETKITAATMPTGGVGWTG